MFAQICNSEASDSNVGKRKKQLQVSSMCFESKLDFGCARKGAFHAKMLSPEI